MYLIHSNSIYVSSFICKTTGLFEKHNHENSKNDFGIDIDINSRKHVDGIRHFKICTNKKI